VKSTKTAQHLLLKPSAIKSIDNNQPLGERNNLHSPQTIQQSFSCGLNKQFAFIVFVANFAECKILQQNVLVLWCVDFLL
jgi:hypothetical protein